MNDKRRASKTHSAATNEDDMLPDDVEGEENEDESDEDAGPGVVLGRLRDLGRMVDPTIVKQYGDLPVWFLIEDDAELVELFDRIPERPLPQKPTQAILGVLRQFAASESDALQELLGPTDTIGLGFHASANFDEVVESFEDDGFDVLLGLDDGKVRFEEE